MVSQLIPLRKSYYCPKVKNREGWWDQGKISGGIGRTYFRSLSFRFLVHFKGTELMHFMKKMHFIWVSMYLARKCSLGTLYFTSPNGDRTAILPCSSEPREGLACCSAKGVPSFLGYFKTLSIGPVPGIEPATSRSAVKRSTDWANCQIFHLWFFLFLFIRLPQYNRRLFNIPNVSHKPDKVSSSDVISHPSDTNIATCFTTKTDGLVPRL